jgi:hypothetical protein
MQETRSAETWDSYYSTIKKIHDNSKISRVLEWGSGKSTDTFSRWAETVDSVEHNPAWVILYPPKNVRIIFEPSQQLYPLQTGRFDEYDLIFVDGICRPSCIKTASEIVTADGIVIVHDAERKEYQDSYRLFKHSIFTDDGHTVVLTNSDEKKEKLLEWLK